MDHTLVAIFDNETHAQDALNDLISMGIPRTDVHIKHSQPMGMTEKPAAGADNGDNTFVVHHAPSLGAKIESFFQNLFGGSDSDPFAKAAKRGNPLLIMKTGDDTQLTHAIDLLKQRNPIDVRECSSQWAEAQQAADTYSPADTSCSSPVAGTQETDINSGTAARIPEETPAAQTVYPAEGQRMAALTGLAEPGMVPGDLEFRSHWQTSYAHQGGRYEDYAPAYQYGSTVRVDERYKDRSWDEIEPQIRTDWEAKHADSPWEKAKDAVRAAWERGMQ